MTYVPALVIVVVVIAAQWFFTSRALRSPSYFIGWVTGGYAVRITLLAIELYVPHALGMDVKVTAFATIIAIIVSLTVEMMIMMCKRTMSMDAPSDTQ